MAPKPFTFSYRRQNDNPRYENNNKLARVSEIHKAPEKNPKWGRTVAVRLI